MRELSEEALLNFQQGSYHLPETGDQHHKLQYWPVRASPMLAMGFTGKKALSFKLAYIAAFNQMEAAPRSPHL